MTMLKKQIRLNDSPFEKQRNMSAPRGSINLQSQVSQDMFDDFMRFALQYNVEHRNPPKIKQDGEKQHNKANPLKHIINEFLNSHALERKCFDDLHVIMIVSNPFDFNMRKSAVIGFVRHPEKFTKFQLFNVSMRHKYQTGLVYALEEFNKDFYDMLNLNSFDREVLFDIPPSIYNDFDKVRERLQAKYEKPPHDIDFDNAFFVMFNLNNYFDILQDGVYVSEHSRDKHDGAIILCNADYEIEMLCVLISWSYHNSMLNIEFHVEDEGFFRLELSGKLPPAPYREFWSISTGFMKSDIAHLEMDLSEAKQSIKTYENAIAMKERQIERIERKLDILKQ